MSVRLCVCESVCVRVRAMSDSALANIGTSKTWLTNVIIGAVHDCLVTFQTAAASQLRPARRFYPKWEEKSRKKANFWRKGCYFQ